MSRPNGLSRAYASVSVIAVLGLLAGCSQPASYATVDLSGSYTGNAPQAYSAASGLPVYTATQGYTTPSYDVAPARNQLAYSDAPINQVASLAPSYGGYAEPYRQSYPSFGSVVQGETLTDETILRSDGFIDIGSYGGATQYGGTQTASLAPGAGSISLDAMDMAPQYVPAPQAFAAPQYTPAPQAFAAPQYAPAPPAMVEAAPVAAPVEYAEPLTVIEASPLPAPVAPPVMVGPDYAAVADDTYGGIVDQNVTYTPPVYTPTVSSIESAPLDMLEAPAQDFAGWDQPARDDVDAVTGYFGLRDARIDGTVQQAALPNALQAAPAPVLRAPTTTGQGLTQPVASEEYVRPYEALPPGFYPPYEFGPADAFVSQAPAARPAQEFAAFEPVMPAIEPFASTGSFTEMPLEQASIATTDGAVMVRSHTVQSGDTLYSIARRYGIAPQSIAETNGIELGGIIYPGNTLAIPAGDQFSGGPDTLGDAPIVVLQTAQATMEEAAASTFARDLTGQGVEMLDLAEIARMYRDRADGGGSMPIISAEAGDALRGRTDMTPTERMSPPGAGMMAAAPVMQAPVRTMPSYTPAPMPVARSAGGFAWPVHGEVYRLDAGQIEIAAPFGAPVAAASSGRVVHVENGARGYLVVIEHDDGWRSLTLGLSGATVAPGQRVMQGSTLGVTGMDRIRFELRDSDANIAETLGILRS